MRSSCRNNPTGRKFCAMEPMELGPDALVDVWNFPTGRGFRAISRINKGQIYLKVPFAKCWSAAKAREAYKELSDLQGHHLASLDEDVMALHLLLERSRLDAGWNAEHLKSLPRSFDMLPHWSEAELLELGEPDLQNTARRLKAQVKGDFSALMRAAEACGFLGMLQENGIDFDAYFWAKSVLWSRCVDFSRDLLTHAGLPLPEGEHCRLLVPGFDMANHDPRLAGTGRTHTILEDGHVALMASVDYNEGDEVCIFYERADNNRLLLWYGFALEDNPFDSAQIRLPVDPKSAARLEKLGATVDTAQGKVYAQCAMTLSDPVPQAAIVAAALCQALIPPESDDELTPRQELEALRLLQRSMPKAAEPGPLPDPASDWRRYCAAVVRTFGPRLQVAFHKVLEAKMIAALAAADYPGPCERNLSGLFWLTKGHPEDHGLWDKSKCMQSFRSGVRRGANSPRWGFYLNEARARQEAAKETTRTPSLLQSASRATSSLAGHRNLKGPSALNQEIEPQKAWAEVPQVAPAALQPELAQQWPSRNWLRRNRKMRHGRI
eukprot:s376_g9.t2